MIRLNELEDNARRFLSRWGMRIEDLKHRAPDVAADECLILCSTIPEGLANQASDIDLIYIGSGDLKSAIRMNINKGVALDVSFDAAGREFNVNRISPEELGELAESIRS